MIASVMAAVVGVVLQGDSRLQQLACDANLDAWLACNNPLVVHYLSELSQEHVGKVLAGVELSDGTMALRDHRFVGQAAGLATGVQVFIFDHEGSRLAYVWVDEGASSLPLPECEGAFPSSAYVLSGDAYTWKAAQPGHGVVKVTCVDPQWNVESSK